MPNWGAAVAALLGGAEGLGQSSSDAIARQRQAKLDALQSAMTHQQLTQGADSHALEVLRAINPLGRIGMGPAPAPDPGTPATPAPGQGVFANAPAGSALAALTQFTQPKSLGQIAGTATLPGTGRAPDRPDRYVQQGNFYVDNDSLDPRTSREVALNYGAYRTIKSQFPDQVGEFTPGINYAEQYPHLLTAQHDAATLGETERHNTADESLRGQELGFRGQELGLGRDRLGVEQGQLGVAQDRLKFDTQFGKPMEVTSGLRKEFNENPATKADDVFATNAAMALQGVDLALQNNNPLGHTMALTGFLRMGHPDAVVRPSDKGMVVEGQGIPGELQAWVQRNTGPGGIVSRQTLQYIKSAAQQMIQQRRQSAAPLASFYGGRARKIGVDSADVVRDPFAALPNADAAAQAAYANDPAFQAFVNAQRGKRP